MIASYIDEQRPPFAPVASLHHLHSWHISTLCDCISRLMVSWFSTLFKACSRNTSDVASSSKKPSEARRTIPSRLTLDSSTQGLPPFERTVEPNFVETDYYTSIQEYSLEPARVYMKHVGCWVALEAYGHGYRRGVLTSIKGLQIDDIKQANLHNIWKIWIQTSSVKEGLEDTKSAQIARLVGLNARSRVPKRNHRMNISIITTPTA